MRRKLVEYGPECIVGFATAVIFGESEKLGLWGAPLLAALIIGYYYLRFGREQ